MFSALLCSALTFGSAAVAPVSSAPRGQGVFALAEQGSNPLPYRTFERTTLTNGTLVADTFGLSRDIVFRRLFESRAGLLKGQQAYRVTFDYRLAVERPTDSALVIVRPQDRSDASQDRLDTLLSDTHGAFVRYSDTFETGDATNCLFKLSAKGGVRFEVRSLRVVPSVGHVRRPVPNADRPAPRPDDLPTGSHPIAVDPPRGNGPVLDAAAFGVSPDSTNNTPALNAALRACREKGASRLVLRKGVYRFTSDAALHFEHLTDFTFDGGGSDFVFWRKREPNFRVTGCTRTVLRDFSVDWDWARDPLASMVRVAAATDETVDLSFDDYERFPRRDVRLVYMSPWDPATRSVGFEGSGTGVPFEFDVGRFEHGRKDRVEWLSDNVLRVHTERARQFAVGTRWRLQHYYYHLNGFQQRDNSHFALEDIEIRSNPGHALVVSGRQNHWRYTRVNIRVPADDPRRVISCTADHCHVARSCGDFLIEDCEFSRGADDCVNIHDNTAYAPQRTAPDTVRTFNCSVGTFAVGDEIELRRTDYSPTGCRARLVEIRTVNRAAGEHDFRFDRPVPDVDAGGCVLFNRSYGTRNVVMRNCFFHDNRARGVIVQADDVTIENCRFRHNESAALKVTTGYTLNVWCEGCGVSNLVVRNCTFEQSNAASVRVTGWARDVFLGTYLRRPGSREMTDYPILRDILFEGCTFRDSYGLVARIGSAADVTFLNNRICNETPRKNEFPYRGGIEISHAQRIRFLGNVWEPSACAPQPEILLDPDTTSDISAD